VIFRAFIKKNSEYTKIKIATHVGIMNARIMGAKIKTQAERPGTISKNLTKYLFSAQIFID
jgi:hypothetical protein